MDDGTESGDLAGLSDELLRDAFLANDDPELTLFLSSLARGGVATFPRVPSISWCDVVSPPEGEGEIGRFDGHVLRKVIAEGPMAVVFLAGEIALERPVALKMLSPDLAGDHRFREDFLREAKAAAALDHECILPLYRVGELPLPYFTMRHVEGGSLQDRLDACGTLGPAEWNSLAGQVASALAAAHAAGLIHRDIKPTNLLYEANGARLWVADFGIAASVREPIANGARRGVVLGTPRYMSPEQARGESVDGRSDLFSLGAILYRCAVGEDLVDGESCEEVFDQLDATDFAEKVRRHGSLSNGRRRLLAGLVSRSPEDRFPDAATFLAALERETRRRSGRSQRRRAFIGLALVGLVVIAGLEFWSATGERRATISAASPTSPSFPSIRIEGSETVYRDIEAALEAAPDGSTLLLDGVFVCRKVHFGPVGRRLSLRPVPGANAIVVASRADEHALFFRGATELRGITFLRESPGVASKPIVGIHGGDAVVRDCRFEFGAMESRDEVAHDPLGAAISFTHLERALVENCRFDAPGREAIFLGFVEGSSATKLTVRNSLFNVGTLAMRRHWDGSGAVEIELQRCAVVADRLFLEYAGNPPGLFSALTFRSVGSWLDLAAPAFHFANDATPEGGGAAPIRWEGSGNRHASPLFRLSWTVPGDGGSSVQTKEIDLGETLVPPLLGSEENLVISPLRPPGGTSPTLEQLEAAVDDDTDFLPIRAKEEG